MFLKLFVNLKMVILNGKWGDKKPIFIIWDLFCKFLLDSVLFPHWNLKPKKLLLITQALIKGHVNFQGF